METGDDQFWNKKEFHCQYCAFVSFKVSESLSHLKNSHGIVVENTQQIMPFLDCYLQMKNALPDIEIRKLACQQNLDIVLAQHFKERNSPFNRKCLFCNLNPAQTIASYFRHLDTEHGFHAGPVDNLVFVSMFVDEVKSILDNLQCIKCNGIFEDHITLRKHMRKKKHFRINRRNTNFDRYYVNNYIFDAHTKSLDSESGSDGDFEEWDDELKMETRCLFCSTSFQNAEDCIRHMLEHGFDLLADKDFYNRVRFVNAVRKLNLAMQCIFCDQRFDSEEDLYNHYSSGAHQLVVKTGLDDTFLIPSISDDPLLMIDNI